MFWGSLGGAAGGRVPGGLGPALREQSFCLAELGSRSNAALAGLPEIQ